MIWFWRCYAALAALIIVDLALGVVGPDAEPPFAGTRGVDVGAFYTVATMVRIGRSEDLGDLDAQWEIQRALQEREQTGWRWFEPMPHPPVVALAALPLTYRSLRVAYWWFTIAAALAAGTAAWLLARAFAPTAPVAAALILLAFRPLEVLLWWGGDDAFVLIPIAAAAVLLCNGPPPPPRSARGRDLLAGVLLGMIAIRPQFAAVPFLAFALGRGRVALGMALSGGALAMGSAVLVGWGGVRDYVSLWTKYGSPTLWHPGLRPNLMFSIRGAIDRLDTGLTPGEEWRLALAVSLGLAILVVGVAGWGLRHRRPLDLTLSLVLFGALLTSSHSHQQSMLLLFVPMAIFVARSLAGQDVLSRVLWAVPVVALHAPLAVIAGERTRQEVATIAGAVTLVVLGVLLVVSHECATPASRAPVHRLPPR